jgi:hypothetical protein
MAQDITYVGISGLTYKSTEDGTLIVYGKATGPDLDMDQQICDAGWLKTAMPAWFQTGANVREQHSSIVAGIGLELEANGDDWMLKSEVIDPITKIKVEKKALSGYSIGIKNARVVKDAAAPGGRIVDGDIVEVSLVDRPANPTATVQIAKMAGGQIELSKSDDINQEANHVELPATDDLGLYDGVKVCAACEGTGRGHNDLPDDDTACVTCGGTGKQPAGEAQDLQQYSPSQPDGGKPTNDMVDEKASETEIEKREYSEAERESAAESGAAMPGGSFPIKSVKDLKNAIQSIGRAKDRAAAVAHIKDRAKALGKEDMIPDSFKAVEHDAATLNSVRAGLIALIKAELDEMLNGTEDEIGDVSELLCTLQYFLCWWDDEADEGETEHPFMETEQDETPNQGDDMAYIGLGVNADLIKSASEPQATDEVKTELRTEIRKALGVDEEIASYKAAIAEQEEALMSFKAALDEIREMATPGGPVLRQTSVKANKALDVERLEAEAARMRHIAQDIQDPTLKAAYIAKAAQLTADARSIAKA